MPKRLYKMECYPVYDCVDVNKYYCGKSSAPLPLGVELIWNVISIRGKADFLNEPITKVN